MNTREITMAAIVTSDGRLASRIYTRLGDAKRVAKRYGGRYAAVAVQVTIPIPNTQETTPETKETPNG